MIGDGLSYVNCYSLGWGSCCWPVRISFWLLMSLTSVKFEVVDALWECSMWGAGASNREEFRRWCDCVFGWCGDANIAALDICLLSCVLHFHLQWRRISSLLNELRCVTCVTVVLWRNGFCTGYFDRIKFTNQLTNETNQPTNQPAKQPNWLTKLN